MSGKKLLRTSFAIALTVAVMAGLAVAQEDEADDAAPREGDAGAAVAQEGGAMPPEMQAMMEAWQAASEVGDQHAHLAKAAGSWKMTVHSWLDPSAPPMTSEGTAERVMVLGGRVLEETIESEMMGQSFQGVGRHGYDNVTGKYWSTWTDNMSTGLYVSHGTADEDGTITSHGEFQSPMNGETIKVRTVMRWKDESTHVFEWHEDRGEGEMKTMEVVYQRP